MKLFLDRNKTLLPRIEIIYFLTRVMTLAGVGWLILFGDLRTSHDMLFTVMLATFVAHLGLFLAAMYNRFDIKLAYLSAIIYDMVLIPTLILHTGGVDSPFYLLFYLTISIAAYVLTFWFAAAVALISSVTYVLTIWTDLSLDNLFDNLMRLGFVWVYFLAIAYASEFLRKSERRLLKLFDTLNLRTSELEKFQAQLELIYDNSRVLASILDTEGVVKEVMRILGNILQYDNFAIVFRDRWGNFYYRARLVEGQLSFHPKAIDIERMELVRKVTDVGEPIRILDVSSREDYLPLSQQSKGAMIVPLISHGRTHGVLSAESNTSERITDRDMQMLTVVARSAALAIENAELHRRTEELTVIDELTETFNYRYFIQKLQEERRRSLRYSLPLSLIMVDIDHFKKLNDTYGHENGNKVLRSLSAIMKECIRDVDIFCRYGGEEFVVILPQTKRSEASTIGERIRSQVEKHITSTPDGRSIQITVSVGVSSFPENGKSHEELVSVADQALYRAKDQGRNLVCII